MLTERLKELVDQVNDLKQSKEDAARTYRQGSHEHQTEILRLRTILVNTQRRYDQIRKVADDPGGSMADIRQFFR